MSKYLDNNGHTESLVTLFPDAAYVKVRMLPGYRTWTRPSAALVRKWVDAAIAESDSPNRRRASVAMPFQTETGWGIRFALSENTN